MVRKKSFDKNAGRILLGVLFGVVAGMFIGSMLNSEPRELVKPGGCSASGSPTTTHDAGNQSSSDKPHCFEVSDAVATASDTGEIRKKTLCSLNSDSDQLSGKASDDSNLDEEEEVQIIQLFGTVVDESGIPMGESSVSFGVLSEDEYFSYSIFYHCHADVVYTDQNGRWSCTIERAGFGKRFAVEIFADCCIEKEVSMVSKSTVYNVEAGNRAKEIRLELLGLGLVEAEIQDIYGTPVNGAELRVDLPKYAYYYHYSLSNDNGHLEVDHVPYGTWGVTLSGVGLSVIRGPSLVTVDSRHNCAVFIVDVSPTLELEAYDVSPEKERNHWLRSVSVEYFYEDEHGAVVLGGRKHIAVDEPGYLKIAAPLPGTYRLTLKSDGYNAMTVNCVIRSPRDNVYGLIEFKKEE